jgi:hypothetical protein
MGCQFGFLKYLWADDDVITRKTQPKEQEIKTNKPKWEAKKKEVDAETLFKDMTD